MTIPPSAIGPITGTLASDVIFEEAKRRGEKSVKYIGDLTEANDLEIKIISRFETLVRHGYKYIDIFVRRDSQEYRFEGDWLARLFRGEIVPNSLGEEIIQAACQLISSDIIVHPMMSREEAVRSGYDRLNAAVGRWTAAQPPQRTSDSVARAQEENRGIPDILR